MQEVEVPRIFRKTALAVGKVVIPTHRLPSRPQDQGAAERIKSMTDLKDPIKNRTCHLSACGAVPKPTALPRTPAYTVAATDKCCIHSTVGVRHDSNPDSPNLWYLFSS
jgi:hypothetical protein